MNPTVLRRVQMVLLLIGVVITTMGLVMIAGCHRNDKQIDANLATVTADVVSADALHAAVNFQTADGQFHSPRLGLLYPTELTQGQRIRVDYDATNPDLARPTGRSWTLSIIPGLSVAVIGWVLVGAVMLLLAEINRRRSRDASAEIAEDQDETTDSESSETSTA